MTLVPTFLGLITEIQIKEELVESVSRSIRTFKSAIKKSPDSASSPFIHVRFPELGDRAQVDTDDMQISLSSLLETLQYGKFDNIFEAWHCIRVEPVLPPNFNYEDLKQELVLFMFESHQKILVWP